MADSACADTNAKSFQQGLHNGVGKLGPIVNTENIRWTPLLTNSTKRFSHRFVHHGDEAAQLQPTWRMRQPIENTVELTAPIGGNLQGVHYNFLPRTTRDVSAHSTGLPSSPSIRAGTPIHCCTCALQVAAMSGK